MAHLDAYLFFDGTCAAAMRFYETALGGRLEMMQTFAETPEMSPESAPSDGDRIMHARLDVDGRALLASDVRSTDRHEGMHGFALSINYTDVARARRVFDALAAGGSVTMPMGETFWAQSFGMLTDKFGVSWMVNVDKPKP
jgi:PhnB protein